MDPYAPCPCGSGKKVKFCCQKLIPEMERIERLQENQPEAALAHLNKLEQSDPGNPWVVTTRAGVLMQQGEFPEAKLALLKFLREHPDHPRANALYAFAAFHADGYPACKKAVHRAFKRCVEESPRIVSALMEALGEQHYMQANLLAARAHLVLAMRIAATPEDRERLIRAVIRFDADRRIPFLLRGGQRLPAYEPPEAAREPFERALHLNQLACWEEAADLLEPLAEQDSKSAELWHLVGLYRAWDGDEESAAEALHRASALYSNRSVAVECETIAQFLDQSHSDRVVPMRMQRYSVSSVAQLLSRLDDHPRFARSDDSGSPSEQGADPAATYLVLDRALPAVDELSGLTADSVPIYLGRVLIFNGVRDDNLPPAAYLTGLAGEQLEAAEAIFLEAARDLVERQTSPAPAAETVAADAAAPEPADAELDVIGEIHEDELPLHRNYFVPPGAPGDVRAAIVDEHWRRCLDEIWPGQPLEALQGKTPLEAGADPALQVALEAAINLLESFCDERSEILPLSKLRSRLNLAPSAPPPADAAVAQWSSFDLQRIDPPALSDVQLRDVVDRLRLSPQSRLLYAAIHEWVERGLGGDSAASDALSTQEALTVFSALASEAPPQEALDAIARGIQSIPDSDERSFEKELFWKMSELRVRVAYSSRDEVRALLLELWEKYGAKLPSLRSQLVEVTQALGIDPPWESAIVTADGAWSPQSGSAPESKKLWLPGQD